MRADQATPKTQPSGAKPPPRPPIFTSIALVPDLPDDDGDNSNRRWRKNEVSRINLPPKPSDLVTAGRTVSPAMKHSLHAGNFFSASLVLCLQVVLLFEACASVDHAVGVLFSTVALLLTIPGYLWAFEGMPFKVNKEQHG